MGIASQGRARRSSPRGRIPRRALALGLSALGLLVATPGVASAASFTEYMASKPDGTSVPAGPWANVNYGSTTGGPFGVYIPDVGAGWSQTATLAAPANLAFGTVTATRTLSAGAGWAVYQPTFNTTWENRGYQGGGGYGGDFASGDVTVNGPGSLYIQGACSWFGGSDPSPRCTGSSYWAASRITAEMVDSTLPSGALTSGGGSILDGAWKTSTNVAAAVTASDQGGGVYRAWLRDGGTTYYASIDPSDTSCQDAVPGGSAYQFVATASSLVPCKTGSQPYTPTFDLTGMADGVHANVSLGVEDAAGNEQTLATGQTLRTNLPGGLLNDPGTPCQNGTYDESGTCIKRAPSSTTAPALSGAARSGQTISTGNGSWNDIDAVSWTYQWQLCSAAGDSCANIPGANASTLTLNDAMVGYTVRATVTANTDGGTTSAQSGASDQITLANGTLGGGNNGGAGGVRPAAVRAAAGGGGGGLSADQIDNLPVPAPDYRFVGILNGENASENSKLTVQTVGAVKYGASQALTGLLVNAAGAPIAGARLEVIVHQDVKGAQGKLAGVVRTSTDGTFRYVLPAGSSRIVTFAYRTSLSDDHYDEIVSTRVGVAEPVSLKADRSSVRNGQTVRFSGKVSGVPAGMAHTAAIQVRVGRSWQTITTASVRNGAFSSSYRFERTTRTQTYTFRVSVARTADWPYLDSASRSTKVKVIPAAAKKRSSKHGEFGSAV